MKAEVYKPKCIGCKFYMFYSDYASKKSNGVLMKSGKSYCLFDKRAKELKTKDLDGVPIWCGRLNSPPILRVYCFKDSDTRFRDMLFNRDGRESTPTAYQYAMRYEGESPMSAYNLAKELEVSDICDLLKLSIKTNEIVEIDDGINPYYFWQSKKGTTILAYFQGESARQNTLED